MLKFFTISTWVKIICVSIMLLDILFQPFLTFSHFGPNDIGYYRNLPQKFRMVVRIEKEPDVRSDSQNLIVEVQDFMFRQDVHGKMMVKADRYPEYFYGDLLDISCKLQAPPIFEKFSYSAYLAGSDIFVMCMEPHIIKLPPNHDNVFTLTQRFFFMNVYGMKSSIVSQIDKLFTEPQAVLVTAILTGQRHMLPQEIADNFNATGLTHVLAVDGYKVSLMIAVLGYLLKGAARYRRYAAVFLGIAVLVVFSGFTASVLRAAWMASIALLAEGFGRKGSGVHLLLISAALMVVLNPRMILVDASFQFSFLATLGILVLMPKVKLWEQEFFVNKGFSWIEKIPSSMREAFWITVVAEIFTMPLLFYSGEISLIAPLANLFVVPLLPWIMVFAFCSVVGSFIFWPLGQLVAFVGYIFLSIMLLLTNFFAGLPFAALHV